MAEYDELYFILREANNQIAWLESKADALAIAGEKAENVLEVLLERFEIWEGRPAARGTATAALRELSTALRQYKETR